MIKIKDTKLFLELLKDPSWGTLFDRSNPAYPEIKNPHIPTLAGGLDHIVVKEYQVEFHDIGISNSGRIRDNSSCVVPEVTMRYLHLHYNDDQIGFFGTPWHLINERGVVEEAFGLECLEKFLRSSETLVFRQDFPYGPVEIIQSVEDALRMKQEWDDARSR